MAKKAVQNKEEAKISIDDLSKVYDAKYQQIEEFEWEGMTIKVKKNLTLPEVFQFTKSVVASCFSDETGEYMPEVRNFMVMYETLNRYSNIEVSDDIEEMYRLLYCTDIYMAVISHVDSVQYNQITSAVDKRIRYQLKSNVSAVTKQVNEMVAAFNNLQSEMAKLFSDIKPGDIKNVIDTFSNGNMTEGKIVDAVMEHRKSDTAVM